MLIHVCHTKAFVEGRLDVELVVRHRDVVYSVVYANRTEGANVEGVATSLATTAIGKVVATGDWRSGTAPVVMRAVMSKSLVRAVV
ncbi:hypothetical protein ACRAKI_12130 [Saccharothrix isguenensis]